MSIFSSIGKAVKGVGKVVGKGLKIASPFAALIPGVGPLAAAGMGAAGTALGRALNGENTFGKGGLGQIAKGGLMAGAGGLATGGQGFKGLANAGTNLKGTLGTIGKAVSKPGMLGAAGGGLDLGKTLGVAAAGTNLIGAQQQRKSNQQYSNAQTDMRNQLMSRILAGMSPQ